MSNYTKENIMSWESIYNNTEFGNKYPSSYFVSLYHREIKQLMTKDSDMKVLDFGCSNGAIAKMMYDLGADIYGIDVSEKCIDYCVNVHKLSHNNFKCADILNEAFPFDEKFDLIICSEVLYYFGNKDLCRLLEIFNNRLNDRGIIYASMCSFAHPYYRQYKSSMRNEDGLIAINESGTASKRLYVNVMETKDDLRELFTIFAEKFLYSLKEEFRDGFLETFHYVGQKSN